MAITLEFARGVGRCNQLGILYKEDAGTGSWYNPDTKVTFAFVFDRTWWEQGEFLAQHLIQEVAKIFPDARLTCPIVEPRNECPAYIVFSKTVCGQLENPDGLLRFIIGKFEPALEEALKLSAKDMDDLYEAELEAEQRFNETGW